EDSRLIYEINRRLITAMVEDTLRETQRRYGQMKPRSVEEIRALNQPFVAFSQEMSEQCEALRFYLFSWVYRNPRVTRIMAEAQQVLNDLFTRYMEDPQALPPDWRGEEDERGDEACFARKVCDFIAGMTDRYALNEHRRLFDDTPELR
ncbi:MAG: deoxyguanosinetriphosphate triphosphohydrolase, partial [Alphaproteobacteria bacterium]